MPKAATPPIERTITPTVARRLAITRQRLAGPRPAPGPAGIREVARDLGAVQLDPINVVARSHLLVLRSRLGAFDPADVPALLYDERALFEYWAHCASIVPTEDYPIHRLMMAARGGNWFRGSRAWLAENGALRDYVLARLRDEGPLPLGAFEDRAVSGWTSSGWTNGRNVDRMLHILWIGGAVMVAGRQGIHRLWDLAERVLPPWTPREEWEEERVVRAAALRAIRALGVARRQQINEHFTRGRYPDLPAILAGLLAERAIVPVAIAGDDCPAGAKAWAGPWYVHADDLPLLDTLADEGADWGPRTTLLSPFDNLICDRKRTRLLWDFDFTMEIYVPKEKRRWGYYVLPVLHGDRLIARLDPTMDRKGERLILNALHLEPTAPDTRETRRAVADAIAELAAFLGAREIVAGTGVPAGWS